jgi:predicted metal-dependent phosphoesterase TrpH
MTNTKKVIKRKKKVNPKDLAKERVMAIIRKSLEQVGIEYEDGAEYGMTKGTIVVHVDGYDVQIKPIAPRAGLNRYQKVEYEEEE